MFLATDAIFLKQVKYSDSRIIIQCFSKGHGQLSALVRLTKKAKINAYLYPCAVLGLIVGNSNSQGMYSAKELVPHLTACNHGVDPRKVLVRYFMAELLLKTTTKGFPLPHLYASSIDFIQALDRDSCNVPLLPVRFVKMLAIHLGLEPDSTILSKDILLFHHSLDHLSDSGTRKERILYLESMVKHLQDNFHFSELQSYPVLKSIFD